MTMVLSHKLVVAVLCLRLCSFMTHAARGPRLYDNLEFRETFDHIVHEAKDVLSFNKLPVFASDTLHSYNDKFSLAEFVTKSMLGALSNAIEEFPNQVNAESILRTVMNERLHSALKNQSVYLTFSSEEHCVLSHWEAKDIGTGQKIIEESTSTFGSQKKSTRIVNEVNESHWSITVKYHLNISLGRDSKIISVVSETISRTHITNSPVGYSHGTQWFSPMPALYLLPVRQVDITTLFNNLVTKADDNTQTAVTFAINRSSSDCHTPRRNANVDSILDFVHQLSAWAEDVAAYFTKPLFRTEDFTELVGISFQRKYEVFEELQDTRHIFIPILPVFLHDPLVSCDSLNNSCFNEGLRVLSEEETSLLFKEQLRSLHKKYERVNAILSTSSQGISDTTLMTKTAAKLTVLTFHMKQILDHYYKGISLIEGMLFKQLVNALGKTISPHEFSNYVSFHNQRLFLEQVSPVPFSYSVRRSKAFSPEGLLSIEVSHGGSGAQPVHMIARTLERSANYTKMPLTASTSINIGGSITVHGWIHHTFGSENSNSAQFGDDSESFSITASARQFSSYILILGRVSPSNSIDPTHAIVVKDKDFLKIPLEMEVIPTAKEFRDATDSLSPEQQRFARAFRSMQLSSTLFACVVIPIKPQLEKVLNLHAEALTKEIQLSQDLVELVLDYQIPSDLMSNDRAEASPSEGLNSVKSNVVNIKQMIKDEKDKILVNKKMEDTFKKSEDTFKKSDRKLHNEVEFRTSASVMSSGNEKESGGLNLMPGRDHRIEGGSIMSGSAMKVGQFSDFSFSTGSGETLRADSDIKSSGVESDHSGHPSDGFNSVNFATGGGAFDISAIPSQLDTNFDLYGKGVALRSAVINPRSSWSRQRKATLLSVVEEQNLSSQQVDAEKTSAMELLDALTRSGAVAIENAEIHVVIAVTHCFTSTLMDTVVVDNVNPIEEIERGVLIAASTLYGLPVTALIQHQDIERLTQSFPILLQNLNVNKSSAEVQP